MSDNLNIVKINQKCIFNIHYQTYQEATMIPETSTHKKYAKGKIHEIALDQLFRDIDQPRKHFDEGELEALKQSIEEKGLLYPILFRVDENDCNIIVSGERRFKAYQALGREKIPAMFIGSDKYDEVALVDNVQRVDLNQVDLAEATKALKENHKYTDKEIGTIIGKSEQTVSEIIKLADLPQEIRDDARTRNLSRNALLKVARKETPKGQKTAYKQLIDSLAKGGARKPYEKRDDYKKVSTITATAIKGIQSIDLGKLGDNKADVEDQLRQLLTAIQDKLSMIAS
jgi:ParB family transcriptional regulator, chromosome partitioning protein